MDTLSALVQSPVFSGLSAASLLVAGIVFYWWRAGSVHIVLDRLWRLIGGGHDVHDPVLRSMLLESRDVEKFRFSYRLNVETMAEIHHLATWLQTHRVGIKKLQKLRRWVDVGSPEVIREPHKRTSLFLYAAFGISILACLIITKVAGSDNAYLRMRESEVWFKTDAMTVEAIFGGWSFDSKKCQARGPDLEILTGFTTTESDVVCNALRDGSLRKFVSETRKKQKYIGLTCMLAFVWLAAIASRAAAAAQEAARLRNRLYSLGSTATQEIAMTPPHGEAKLTLPAQARPDKDSYLDENYQSKPAG